jgi:hypothetical protein
MLNPVFLSTGQVTLDIIRRSEKLYDRGRPLPPTETIVPTVCNVQPVLSRSDTLLLPEADRSKACLKVYTKGAILRDLKEGNNGWSADRFYWQGDLYEVMKAINYQMGVLNHYKAICMRVELTRP